MTTEEATFANGCFWCTEALFKRLKGIISTESGYSGGHPSADGEYPTEMDVHSGTTGYVEALHVVFDPSVIPYERLLDVFWATHDPTSLDQQGNDIGPEYRSIIFYHSDDQRKKAEASKEELETSAKYKRPVVTQIKAFTTFYKAEAHHQNFYDKNRDYPYCTYIIDPKIQKLLITFKNEIKEEYTS